jgi:hypothetical protein
MWDELAAVFCWREALLEYVVQQEPCLVAMESCGGTQLLAKRCRRLVTK